MFNINKIPITTYKIGLSALKNLSVEGFLGYELHGALGKNIRAALCPNFKESTSSFCQSCTCPYSYLFQPSIEIPEILQKRFKDAPRPYFIKTPFSFNTQYFNAGDVYYWELHVAGNQYLKSNEIAAIAESITARGIGSGKKQWEPEYIITGSKDLEPNPSVTTGSKKQEITISFDSPFLPGEYEKTPDTIPFYTLCRNVAHRLRLLQLFYGIGLFIEDNEMNSFLDDCYKAQIVEQNLRWWELPRLQKPNNSATGNNKAYQLKGWVGKITYRNVDAKYISLLQLGSQINIGQFYAFGLGNFNYSI